jgi:hypothetical protein
VGDERWRMTDNDRRAFAAVLKLLEDVYTSPVTAIAAEAYFRVLRGFELEEIERAVELAVATISKGRPRPAELLDRCEEVRRSRRKALEQAREDQLALQAADSPEDVAAAKQRFAELVASVAARYKPRRPGEVTFAPVTEEDLAAHRAAKEREKARMRLAGLLADGPVDEAAATDNVRDLQRRRRKHPGAGAAS